MTATYNLLIVEDYTLIQIGLESLFRKTDWCTNVSIANSGEEALAQLAKTPTDIAILDIGLPDTNGIALAQQVRAIYPDIKIIMLTSHDNQREVLEALSAGAQGYCLKGVLSESICDIVKQVADGGLWLDPGIAKFVVDVVDQHKPSSDSDDDYALSDRELEILRLVSYGNNNDEIAKALFLSTHSIKQTMTKIFDKLSVSDRTEAVAMAIRNNIIE